MNLDLGYEDAQLILRALKGHAGRMQKIAEQERLIGHLAQAEVAVAESRMAAELAAKFERGGVRMS